MIARFAGDSALDASVAQVALHRIQGSLTDFTFMKGDDLVHARQHARPHSHSGLGWFGDGVERE